MAVRHRHERVAAKAGRALAVGLGVALVGLLVVPVVALLGSVSLDSLTKAWGHPTFGQALWLSLRTSLVSLTLVVLGGVPLSWWLARTSSRLGRLMEVMTDLPIILPPAVVGVALLQTFGQAGLFGSSLQFLGLQVSFRTSAVVLAQVVVSAPFFIQSATSAFRRVDMDMLLVAQTLGASPAATFMRVVIPVSLPGLLGGVCLAWARALGEFGATLLFAGNLPGETQTIPLAIYMALESDIRLAVALSFVLVAVGLLLLVGVRFVSRHVDRGRA